MVDLRAYADPFAQGVVVVAGYMRHDRVAAGQAQVLIGQPEHHGGRDRRQWAQDLRHQVMRLRGE